MTSPALHVAMAGDPFRIASTFSGIGGLESGFLKRGAQLTALVEWDENAQKVLAHHHPTTPLMGDINNVSGTSIGRPHLVSGGFPCINITRAAPDRSGLLGPKSSEFYGFANLVEEHLRLVEEADARWVLLENARDLAGTATRPGSNGGRDLALVVRGLEQLGYGWAFRVVDSRKLGALQPRYRTIVVGHRGGDPVPAGRVLGLVGDSSEDAAADPVRHRAGNRPPIVDADAGFVRDGVRVFRKSARARAKLSEGGYETWVPALHSNTLTGFDGGGPARQTHLIEQDGRLRAPTLTEWERLSGFPDGWTDVPGNPRSARFTQLGNCVHTATSDWVAEGIMREHAALPQIGATRSVLADVR